MGRYGIPLLCIALTSSATVIGAATPPTIAQYLELPLAFERVTGAGNDRYVARGDGYAVSLGAGSAVIGLHAGPSSDAASVSMEFAGGRVVPGVPSAELPGKVNHIRGNNPKEWRLGLPTFRRVAYEEVYPGIDLVFYGNQRRLEFDLVVKPGADPRKVRIRFIGAQHLSAGPDGGVVIETAAGNLQLLPAAIYQQVDGAKLQVEGAYALASPNEVELRLGKYDSGKPLVIDPEITCAGLLGGGTGASYGNGVAVGPGGDMYIVGYTYAADIATAGPGLPYNGNTDGFVTKIDSAGTALLYSTYLGGAGMDYLKGISIDSTGAAWVAGWTYSSDFPVLNAYQSTFNGSGAVSNATVSKLSPTGALLYSTFLGSASGSSAYGIAVDSSGDAYVTGKAGPGFPTTSGGFLTDNQGQTDAFAAKFTSAGSLAYSTVLGGAANDSGVAIAVDAAGNSYIAGSSSSATFSGAPAGGFRTAHSGTSSDAFVAKLNASGSSLSYFTFLGGSDSETASGIAVDEAGHAFVTGYTSSADFPTTPEAFQKSAPAGRGDSHGFVSELNADGSGLVYSTYLAGNRSDAPMGLAIDSAGDAFVAGSTSSDRFPIASAVEPVMPGNPTSLFRTTDAGASWEPFDQNIPGAVLAVSPDPADSRVMVAGATAGVFRTADSGASWSLRLSLPIDRTVRSPADGNTIYGVSHFTVYRSTDGGVTWDRRGTVLTTTAGLVADPSDAATAYAFSNTELASI